VRCWPEGLRRPLNLGQPLKSVRASGVGVVAAILPSRRAAKLNILRAIVTE
jgi:hypothetical protein